MAPLGRSGCGIFLALVVLPAASLARSCVEFDEGLRSVGSYGLACSAIEAGEGFLLAQHRRDAMLILDLANPRMPTVRDSILAAGIQDFACRGDLVYVAMGWNGLQIFDAKAPHAAIGGIQLPGYVYRVVVEGTRGCMLITAAGGSHEQLVTLNFADPTNPVQGGSVGLARWANRVTFVGDTAVVAAGDSGVQIVDVSNPNTPRIVANKDVGSFVTDVASAGSYAYLATSSCSGPTGLVVLDLADPSVPVVMANSREGCAFPHKIEVEGDIVYRLGASAFSTTSVESPTLPRRLGSIYAPSGDFAVAGGHAYLTTGPVIQIVDLAEPRSPAPRWSLDLDADRVIRDGGYAFVTTFRSQVQVVQLAEPQQVVATIAGNATDVAVAGTHAYVVDVNRGLRIFDITTPSSPVAAGEVALPGSPGLIEISGTYAYISAGISSSNPYWRPGALHIVDITDPNAPQWVGSAELSRRGNGLKVEGHLVFVATGFQNIEEPPQGALEIVDVSDPSAPAVIGRTTFEWVANDIDLEPGRAWIVGGSAYGHSSRVGKLATFDVTQPHAPLPITTLTIASNSHEIVRTGSLALVAASAEGVVVFDALDAAMPRLLGRLHIPGAKAMQVVEAAVLVVDDGVYCGTRGNFGEYPLPCDVTTPVGLSALEAELVGDEVRLRWHTNLDYEGFAIQRARDTGAFELVATMDACGQPSCEFWDRDVPPATYHYAIEGRRAEGGHDILGPVTVTVSVARQTTIRALQSPARGRVELMIETPGTGLHDVQIYDVAGRMVRTWTLGSLTAGRHAATWDGRDAGGHAVASGLYVLRLRNASTRVVLLR